MKRILITGANSYIGTSFEKWVSKWPDQYQVDTVDMIGDGWRKKPFTGFDAVFHVAGIAHVSTNPKLKDLYFKINRDLAIETAKKAKAEGVSQFVFMSSIIVYGDSAPIGKKKVITRDTVPQPDNYYGQSKLEAEEGIMHLQDSRFQVVILRPPMIYGKGGRGNYSKLSKAARMMPFFPYVKNERSMLYVDNLCEFVRLMVNDQTHGIFFPQNSDYMSSSEMVRAIAHVHGKKAKLITCLNLFVQLGGRLFPIVNKVFGNIVYDKNMSVYKTPYQIVGFSASIEKTESN